MPAAPTLEGLSATGKHQRAPGVELFEYASENGLKHVALVVQDPWRSTALLGADLQGRLGFMEQPEVAGLARLTRWDPDHAAFVYPTGTVWSVAEVVRYFADTGAAAGVKAGLELCYLVAETLVEAAESGFPQGVYGHGNVSPWTLWLKQDGQPVVLGYGVSQLELLAWRENPKIQLTEDSFRYAPPERVEGGSEDVSSDLLSLSLVCLELMTGRPVYDGVLADVRQQAMRGEGVRRLYQWREKLPQNVREVMSRALKADPDTRFPSGMDFVHAVHDLLGSIDVEGPSLVEVMARVRASERRGRAAGRTGALSPQEMAEIAADLDAFEDRPLPPPRRSRAEDAPAEAPSEKPRWGRVQRPQATPAPAAEAGDRPRRRLRQPDRTATEPVVSVPASPGASPNLAGSNLAGSNLAGSNLGSSNLGSSNLGSSNPGHSSDADARERLRRRLRESAPIPAAAGSPPAHVPAPAPLPPPAPAPLPPPVAAAGPTTLELSEVDLSAPDDVLLEPATGKPPGLDERPEPRPAAPASPPLDTGQVLASAVVSAPASARDPRASAGAARAVEAPRPPEVPRDLRRSADVRAEPAPPPPTPHPPPPPAAVEPPPPAHPVGSAAAALLERLRTSGGRRRRPGEPPAPAPPGSPAPAALVPPADATPEAVTVRWRDAAASVPAGPAREVAAAVAARLHLPLVDLTGRFLGGFRLFRHDTPLPGGEQVAGGELELRRVRSGPRPVRFALPDGRSVELPVEVGMPARWVVAGLVEWGLAPDPGCGLWIDARAIDPAEPLSEAFDAVGPDGVVPPLVSVRTPRVS